MSAAYILQGHRKQRIVSGTWVGCIRRPIPGLTGTGTSGPGPIAEAGGSRAKRKAPVLEYDYESSSSGFGRHWREPMVRSASAVAGATWKRKRAPWSGRDWSNIDRCYRSKSMLLLCVRLSVSVLGHFRDQVLGHFRGLCFVPRMMRVRLDRAKRDPRAAL